MQIEDIRYVYTCDTCQENEIEYENIFWENVKRREKYMKFLKQTIKNKEYQKKFMKSPRDPLCDPLYSLSESSNGNIT